MNRRNLLILSGAALCAAAIVGAVLGWRAHQRGVVLADSVPARPDLSQWPPELPARIASCEARIAAGNSPVSALGELGRLYHANGFLPEAATCYVGLEWLAPDEGRWAYRHALILSGYGENEPAVERLRRVADLPVEYVPARLRLGETLLKLGDISASAEVYAAVRQAHPDEPYALLGLARCDIERERWEDARTKLERLVDMTNYALGYDLIVSVYERLGQDERAAAIRGQMRAWGAFRDMTDPWMEELLEDSYDAYQLSLAAGAAERRPDLPLAIRRMERSVALAPDSATLRFQLGMLYLQGREYTKSREQLERCTRLAPDFADGWAHLSGVLSTVGDRTGSDRAIEEGLRRCPDSPGLHLMQAARLKKAGRLEEAIAEFRRSIELRPTEADAYIQLGVTLMGANRTEEGLAVLESALVAEPQHPFVLYTLALHAMQTRDEASARRWMEQARRQPRVKAEDLQHLVREFTAIFGKPPP